MFTVLWAHVIDWRVLHSDTWLSLYFSLLLQNGWDSMMDLIIILYKCTTTSFFWITHPTRLVGCVIQKRMRNAITFHVIICKWMHILFCYCYQIKSNFCGKCFFYSPYLVHTTAISLELHKYSSGRIWPPWGKDSCACNISELRDHLVLFQGWKMAAPRIAQTARWRADGRCMFWLVDIIFSTNFQKV